MSHAEIEAVLAEEWCTVLAVPDVQDEVDFFEVGGDSLAAMELAARFEDRTKIHFPIDVLLGEGTFAAVKAGIFGATE